jgi:hypothetical protein
MLSLSEKFFEKLDMLKAETLPIHFDNLPMEN